MRKMNRNFIDNNKNTYQRIWLQLGEELRKEVDIDIRILGYLMLYTGY